MGERVFVLPDPGEGLTEAEIVAWLVAEGEEVELNAPLVEVETAKAAVEIPSPFAGRVARLHAAAGETVEVGHPLVTFDVVEDVPAGGGDTAGAVATPAVRAVAKRLGVELSAVEGSGPGGRVTADDVQRAASTIERWPAATPFEDRPVAGVHRVAAERLTKVVRETPLVTTFRTVDCTALEAVRRELEVSPLPIVLRALAEICAEHPLLNAAWVDEPASIRVFGRMDAGIGVDTERGLAVGVVRDVGGRGIGELAGEIRRLAEAARSGRLAPDDVGGSTITVSNTGSYGSEAGTPIPEPGVAVVLAIGAIAPRALVVEGQVVPRPACTLSMTFDHRVLDGAAAGRALTDLVALLQDEGRLRALPR
jgi:pyruvate dehydrogenase E2 component (dihydrolipoamide acetyltransferase)